MAHADAAMYHTKETGRNGYTFTPSMQLSANRQLRLLQDLRKAIARDELILHYQPVPAPALATGPAAALAAPGAGTAGAGRHPHCRAQRPDPADR